MIRDAANTAAAVLVVGLLLPQARGSEAEIVLSRVALKYASLKSYWVRVKNWAHMDGRPMELNNDWDLAYRDDTHFRYSVKNGGSRPRVAVSNDSRVLRSVRFDEREYLEEQPAPINSNEPPRFGVRVFASLNARLVQRFRNVSQFANSSKLIGTKRIRNYSGVEVEAILVELKSLPEDQDPWVEQLWIDRTSHLIVKSAFSNLRNLKYGSWGINLYEYVSINEPIPDEVFLLPVPAGCKRVNQFSRPRGH